MAGVERLRRYFRDGIWEAPDPAAPRWSLGLLTSARVVYISAAGFADDLCTTRASALAFGTLIALVPVLALTFAVLRGLGWQGDRLETLILNKATVLSPEAIDTIVSYVDKVNFAGLGVVGGAFVLVTFVSLVTNVEGAFNTIWDDVPARTLGRRVTDYFGVIVVAPILLVVAMSLSVAVRGHPVYEWLASSWGLGVALDQTFAYVAWIVSWVLFAFLYVFVPNTRVRLLPAVVGGAFAALVWQLTQWAYLEFRIGMSNYDAIYGALAQLPLLMVWVYVSWVIVLLGAEISHAVQTVQVFSRERRAAARSGQMFREWIGLGIAVELARSALRRAEPSSADALAILFDVPPRTVRDVVAAFAREGLAHESGSGCIYLSLAPQCVPLVRVINVLRGTIPSESAHPTFAESARRAHAVLERMNDELAACFGGHTLRDAVLNWPLAAASVSGDGATAQGSADFEKDRADLPKGEA